MRVKKDRRIEPKGDILAIDPGGGDSNTGLFLYRNYNDYEIRVIRPETWQETIKIIRNWLKKGNVKHLAVEIGKLINRNPRAKYFLYDFRLQELIKVIGVLEDQAERDNIDFQAISNQQVANIGDDYNTERGETIKGLSRQGIRTPKGRTRKAWIFRGQELSEHEKDAVIIFYIFWTKKLFNNWPWNE